MKWETALITLSGLLESILFRCGDTEVMSLSVYRKCAVFLFVRVVM